MKDLMKVDIDGVIFIVKNFHDDQSLKENDYSIEVVSSTKPVWCSNLGRTKYIVTLPEQTVLLSKVEQI